MPHRAPTLTLTLTLTLDQQRTPGRSCPATHAPESLLLAVDRCPAPSPSPPPTPRPSPNPNSNSNPNPNPDPDPSPNPDPNSIPRRASSCCWWPTSRAVGSQGPNPNPNPNPNSTPNPNPNPNLTPNPNPNPNPKQVGSQGPSWRRRRTAMRCACSARSSAWYCSTHFLLLHCSTYSLATALLAHGHR
eukprot:scaffold35322_cov48-Phaeocystis_antarctica.AAC.2